MKYSTVIWDLDGTLLDTLPDLASATNYALRHHHLPEHDIDDIRRFVGNGIRRLIERAVPAGASESLTDDVFNTFKQYYVSHCQELTRPYAGITEAMQTLHRAGVKMAIVSNKLQPAVDELYKIWFRDIIAIAVGERPGVSRKPARDMIDIASTALGHDLSDAVYVGDSDVDIATARNAGMPCISVTWGFRDREFLISHGATTLADTPQEVANIILSD